MPRLILAFCCCFFLYINARAQQIVDKNFANKLLRFNQLMRIQSMPVFVLYFDKV